MRAGILTALVILFATGCRTVQTPATTMIDEIIAGGTLDARTPITVKERAAYKTTFVAARAEIVDLTKKKDTAEKAAQKNARLARQAYIFWGITIFLGIIALTWIALSVKAWFLRRLGPP